MLGDIFKKLKIKEYIVRVKGELFEENASNITEFSCKGHGLS